MMAYCGMVFLAVLSIAGFTEAKLAEPAFCQPWKVPIEVDPQNHILLPHYVEMHICMGQCTTSNNSPLRCECVSQNTQNVTKRLSSTGGLVTKTFKNHTSCKSQCKAEYKKKCINDGHQWDENSCACSCPTSPSGSCPQNQVWNVESCQCECIKTATSCSTEKFWNKSICSCQCSVKAFAFCSRNGWATNMKTCRCETKPVITGQVSKDKENESETKLVVSLVVIGLLLGTLFIIDLVLLCSKKGFIYGLVTKCTERKENQDYKNEAEADTGSMTMDTDLDRRVMNGNCKHKYVTQDSITSV